MATPDFPGRPSVRAAIELCSPELRRDPRGRVAARIDQLTCIRRRADEVGVVLSSAELTLIEALLDRLYRERARATVCEDTLATRGADAFVRGFVASLPATN